MSDRGGIPGAGDGRDRTGGQSGDESRDAVGGESGEDPFAGYVFDEEFVRGAAKSEGSARARMLAQRWRESPPEPTQPWRAGPAPRERRGPGVKLVIALVVVVVLAAVASDLGRARGWFGGESSTSPIADGSPNRPQSTGGATPGAGRQGDPNRPTKANPFAGTPAVNFADNEAGLILPEVKAVSGYTVGEITNALTLMRGLLIAGNLDRDVLMGVRPTAYLDLLDRVNPIAARLETALATNRGDDGASGWLTRFDRGEVELVGSIVKVKGELSYLMDADDRLTVQADVSFVYPVARPGSGPSGAVTRSVVRRVLKSTVFRASDPTPRSPGKVWLKVYGTEIANTTCVHRDGFVHPRFPQETEDRDRQSAMPSIDPYDTTRRFGDGLDDAGCGNNSRV